MWTFLRRRPLPVILLAALVLRLAAAFAVQWQLDHVLHRQFLIEGDAGGYWELAQRIAAGEEFAVYDPPRRVMRMPGFPALLAVSVGLFGESLLAARVLLGLVATGACWLVYLLGRELLDRPTGLVAAALTAASPVMAGFGILVLSETLFAAALVVSLFAAAKLVRCDFAPADKGRGYALALLTGVAAAAANYVRPSWLLAVPVFLALYTATAGDRRQALARSALVVVGVGVALAPWTYRNYRVTGHFVPTTLWMGPSLYDGLNPQATGASDMRFFDDERLMERMSEYEVDRHYRERAWAFARENPRRAVELAAAKLWRFWKPWPSAAEFGGVGPAVAVAAWFVPLLGLAAWGWWLARGRFWAWTLAAGPVLYFSGVHMIFVGSLRYRLPAEYPLCVLSAVGLRDLWGRWRRVMPGRSRDSGG